MPTAIADLIQGLPVEIGKIDRELKRLWQQDEGTSTRASHVNLAVYCEGPEAMEESTSLIAEITREHACRALLIVRDPEATGSPVQASISAHCHTSRAGAKQVCCEQITFVLGCDGLPLIPNIVFSHLDSDLPLYLWWRAELPEKSEDQLWTWVDRLLYDSREWSDPAGQIRILREAIIPASQRITLCDLNWTRSLYIRQAVAQLFDQHLDLVASLSSGSIVHGPGMRSTALLLAAWLAGQLRYTLKEAGAELVRFSTPDGRDFTISLAEAAGWDITSLELHSGASTLLISHREGSCFLHADVQVANETPSHFLLPGGCGELAGLLNDELMSGGRHRVYLKALGVISGAL